MKIRAQMEQITTDRLSCDQILNQAIKSPN